MSYMGSPLRSFEKPFSVRPVVHAPLYGMVGVRELATPHVLHDAPPYSSVGLPEKSVAKLLMPL